MAARVAHFTGRARPIRLVSMELLRSYSPQALLRLPQQQQPRPRRRLPHWKLIWTPGQSDDLRYELYNVATDPHETRNLITDNPETANQLIGLLKEWTDKSGDPEIRKPSAEDIKLLKSLGYVQ